MWYRICASPLLPLNGPYGAYLNWVHLILIKTDMLTRMDIYPRAKFSHDPSRGFFSPYAGNCASKMFTRLLCPGSSNEPQPRSLNRFSRQIRQTTWFRARMCLFRVRKQKLTFNPPYSRKPAIFWPAFDGTWKIFGWKPLYNEGCSM